MAHLDPFGTIFLLLAGFGWAKPVPVTPSLLRWPRLGNFLVSAAGPFTNFLLALLALVALKYGGAWSPGADLWFSVAFQLNLMLMLFNLLPIPPLDGGHLIEALIPRRLLPAWEQLMPYGMVLLLALVFWPFGSPLGKVYQAAAQLMWRVI
jgi:Zn-dependent protease